MPTVHVPQVDAKEIRKQVAADDDALNLFHKTHQKALPVHIGIPFLDHGPPNYDITRHGLVLQPGEVAELTGSSGVGKTEMLYKAALTLAMPVVVEIMAGPRQAANRAPNGHGASMSVETGGQGASVVFFDLDCRFNTMRVTMLLEHHLCTSLRRSGATPQAIRAFLSSSAYTRVRDDTFERISVVRCQDSTQFFSAIHTLRALLQAPDGFRAPLRLIIIDNVAAFYWEKKALGRRVLGVKRTNYGGVVSSAGSDGAKAKASSSGPTEHEIFCERMTLMLKELCAHPNAHCAVLVSKPIYFAKSARDADARLVHTEFLGFRWSNFVQYRIILRAGQGNGDTSGFSGRFQSVHTEGPSVTPGASTASTPQHASSGRPGSGGRGMGQSRQSGGQAKGGKGGKGGKGDKGDKGDKGGRGGQAAGRGGGGGTAGVAQYHGWTFSFAIRKEGVVRRPDPPLLRPASSSSFA